MIYEIHYYSENLLMKIVLFFFTKSSIMKRSTCRAIWKMKYSERVQNGQILNSNEAQNYKYKLPFILTFILYLQYIG